MRILFTPAFHISSVSAWLRTHADKFQWQARKMAIQPIVFLPRIIFIEFWSRIFSPSKLVCFIALCTLDVVLSMAAHIRKLLFYILLNVHCIDRHDSCLAGFICCGMNFIVIANGIIIIILKSNVPWKITRSFVSRALELAITCVRMTDCASTLNVHTVNDTTFITVCMWRLLLLYSSFFFFFFCCCSSFECSKIVLLCAPSQLCRTVTYDFDVAANVWRPCDWLTSTQYKTIEAPRAYAMFSFILIIFYDVSCASA